MHGGNQAKHVEEFPVNNTKFEGQENSETALELVGTMAQIINSIFMPNRKGSYRLHPVIIFHPSYDLTMSYYAYAGFIGGAIIATSDYTKSNISHSRLEDNCANFGGAIFADNSIITMTSNVSLILLITLPMIMEECCSPIDYRDNKCEHF